MEGLIQFLGSVLAAALIALVLKGFQRLGFSVEADRRRQIEAAVKWAVAYAEEYAADYLNKKGAKLPGVEKAEIALSRVLAKIPNIDEEEAADLIKAALPQVGLGATAVGKALRTPRKKKVA